MKKLTRGILLSLLFIAPIGFLSYDDTKDFETAKNLDIFYSLFSEISNSYVDEIAPGDIMDHTITEMLKKLDPYTNFIPESDVERYTIMTKGEYGGIGATVTDRDKKLMITDVQANSPAERGGILVGDFLTEVDGHSIENKPTSESRELLQGQAGTTMKLGIIRNGEKKTFSIVRENIKIKSVPYFCMLDDTFGYVKLNEFSQDCATDVLRACNELTNTKGAKGLILDLRDNPGGLLIEAIKIVNMFVPKGERIVYTKGQNTAENSRFSTITDPFNTEIPLVVLVNENSASAAEIVSGSLQDLDRAVVIGNRTFGKGLVQTRKELAHNCLLKITTSKYYIPSGRCIQKLDYAHRDEQGNPTIVPDSLQKTFYTRNHRPVKDGGGIVPDVVIHTDSVSPLLTNLKKEFVLFDFTTQNYSYGDTAHIKPETFVLSDSDYQKFIAFCKERKNSYKLESEKLLEKLEAEASAEHLDITEYSSALRTQIQKQTEQQFLSEKENITNALEATIIHHLFHEKGDIIYNLKDDNYIKEAKNYLTNKEKYTQILSGNAK